MRRGERVLIFALSLSSNAKWIPHMHPLLEADAYCYSTFREAFLPLRSRMRPLLEIATQPFRWSCLVLTFFPQHPSYRIFGHIYGVLNVVEKITNYTI